MQARESFGYSSPIRPLSLHLLQVLVVRSDLNMTKGKIAAQCG